MHENKKGVNILNILLPMLAEESSIHHDALFGLLFGFGLRTNESSGTLLKLSVASATYCKRKIKLSFHSQFK